MPSSFTSSPSDVTILIDPSTLPPPPHKWKKKNRQNTPSSKSAPVARDRVWAEHNYAKRSKLQTTNYSSGFSIFDTHNKQSTSNNTNIRANATRHIKEKISFTLKIGLTGKINNNNNTIYNSNKNNNNTVIPNNSNALPMEVLYVPSPISLSTLPSPQSNPLPMPNTSLWHSQPSTTPIPHNNTISVTNSDNQKLENNCYNFSFLPNNRPSFCNNHVISEQNGPTNFYTTFPLPPPKWKKKNSLSNKRPNPSFKSNPVDRVWAEHSYAKRRPPVTLKHPPLSTNHSSGFSIFDTKSSITHNNQKASKNTSTRSHTPTCNLICFNCESITFHTTSFCPYRPFCRLCKDHHHRGLKSLCKGTTWVPYTNSQNSPQKTNDTRQTKRKIPPTQNISLTGKNNNNNTVYNSNNKNNNNNHNNNNNNF